MIRSYQGKTPVIPKSCYVDESAQIIGEVVLGEHASVWMNAVLRGDVHSIRVGAHSNIQDCSVLHGMKEQYDVALGEYVTVGHSVTLHGCVIEDRCLIGMGSIILNGARIGAGSIIHTRGLTTGLTTAATIFVVASVGMAAGGGLYLTAFFATGLVLASLFALGHLEETFNLKVLLSSYEVTGASVDEITHEMNRILETQHRLMLNAVSGDTGHHIRLQFDVEGCAREQKELFRQMKVSSVLTGAVSLGLVERE